MTRTAAIIGKSGSGKTTITKSLLKVIKKKFPNSSILLVDNDLSLELSESFGIKTRNTIYGIKSGKHEYKTGIPEGMSKQEFIEWALEDIIIEVDENVDIVASWFVTPKDCMCPSTRLMRDSVLKLIERYDFVLFDGEYDLKYLNLLLEYPIDETIIVSKCDKKSLQLASKIAYSSRKYATEGQMDVIINEAKKDKMSEAMKIANGLELDVIGYIDTYLDEFYETDYDEIALKLDLLYSRMNLPQTDKG